MILEHRITEDALEVRWNCTDWKEIERTVGEMQRDISLAAMNKDDIGIERSCERFLGSIEARMLAVHNVTGSDSTKMVGIGEGWVTASDRMKGALALSHRNYVSDPFAEFVKFEAGTKKDRVMCIPTYYDRAMHDLYRMMMEPLVEPLYDLRLFSSRKERSLADAVEEVRMLYSGTDAPGWVVRCDVRSFYDSMSHEWLLENVPMDRDILKQLLDPGRVRTTAEELSRGTIHYEPEDVGHTTVGVPTGNRLSPVLANLILNGLEGLMRDDDDPYNGVVVRWVDDIVITARTKGDAERFMESFKGFIAERGMELNEEKSYIAERSDGFEFLKFDFVLQGDEMGIRPNESSIADFVNIKLREATWAYDDEDDLVFKVNAKIRGFVTKYRISDLSDVAEGLDRKVMDAVIKGMVNRELMNADDVRRRHVRTDDSGREYFVTSSGKRVSRISDQPRVPHERVWLTANPFLDEKYFEDRRKRMQVTKVVKERDLWKEQKGRCAICNFPIKHDQERRIAEDIDGLKGYIHSSCWEDTERTRALGHFSQRFRDLMREEPVEESTEEREQETVPVAIETEVKVQEPVRIEDKAPSWKQDKLIEGVESDFEPARHDPVPRNRVLVPNGKGKLSKFQPLVDYFSQVDYAYMDVPIDYVDRLMEGKLCACAQTELAWWYKIGPGTINNALGVINWGVEKVDFEKRTVRFTHNRKAKPKHNEAEIGYIRRRDPFKGTKLLEERATYMRTCKYGRMTSYLLDCDMDQVLLSFEEIDRIMDGLLPDNAWRNNKWWCNRRDILGAIEMGDFSKVALDMENRTILLTRTCCVPDESKGNVRIGGLRMKENMRR